MRGCKTLKVRYVARGIAAAVTCCTLLSAAPALAAGPASTFTVADFADGNTGSCSAPDASGNSVCPTLRVAVKHASTQSNTPTIILQPGIYQLTLGFGGQLDLAASMNIVGTGPGGPGGTTIQQTDGQNRVLQVDGTSTLSGLAITGGHYSPPWSSGQVVRGGGILVLGILALQNALVTGNQAQAADGGPAAGEAGGAASGGGIDYGPSAATGSTIVDSTVTENSAAGGAGGPGGEAGGAASGGGVAYEAAGTLAIQNSTISRNAATGGAGGGGAGGGGTGGAGHGGGIFNLGDLAMSGSTIATNGATGGDQGVGPPSPSHAGGVGEGGAISTQGGTDQLVDSTLFGNQATGGAPVTGGTSGQATGGGIRIAGGPNSSVDLRGDTIDANRASSSHGNLDIAITQLEPLTIEDTIVAGGAPDNCALSGGGSTSREDYNLEDDPADTCAFSAVNHDLVGVDPQLASAPADNGGPTQTLAPGNTSPVLGAAGSCVTPTFTSDQRGEPRSTPCDIGAFEGQRPANTTPPAFSGQLTRGSTLLCNPGAWSGDGPLSFGFTWLHNGDVIPGATTNTYVVRAVDAGQSLACAVTASYYGSSTVASPFRMAPSYPVITLLKVFANASVLTVNLGCRGLDGTRCHGELDSSVLETRRGGRVISLAAGAGPRSVSLGQLAYAIPARRVAAIRIHLRPSVTRLLKRFRRIPAVLTVSQTTAVGTRLVTSRHVRIRRRRLPRAA